MAGGMAGGMAGDFTAINKAISQSAIPTIPIYYKRVGERIYRDNHTPRRGYI